MKNSKSSLLQRLTLAAAGLLLPAMAPRLQAQPSAQMVDRANLQMQTGSLSGTGIFAASDLSGFNGTILAQHVAITVNGVTQCYDIVIPYIQPDPNSPIIAQAPIGFQMAPSLVPPPCIVAGSGSGSGTGTGIGGTPTSASAFTAGPYVGPQSLGYGNAVINVAGTAASGVWSVASAPGSSASTEPSNGFWVTTSNSAAAQRAAAAGITAQQYPGFFFGTTAPSDGNVLFAVSGAPATTTSAASLTFVIFANTNGTDSPKNPVINVYTSKAGPLPAPAPGQ